MNFSERMADLFVHGQLVADLMEDGTKAIFALAAVSVANIFWTEQQESQRVKRIRDYSELIRVRDAVMASPEQQIGILPLSFI